MKFLCLHGKGTSAKIFASQTSSFRRYLDASYEFEFVDGLMPSKPAPDIPLFYSPPYYSWGEAPFTLESQREALKWYEEKCEKDGPYDGVMGFSQGCSVIASYLLYHATERPSTPIPFKVAIFICGGVFPAILENVGIHVSPSALEWEEKSRKGLLEKTTTIADLKKGEDRWANTGDLVYDPNKEMPINNIYGLDLSEDNLPDALKVNGRRGLSSVPTLHIFGIKDPRYPQSLQLANLCDERDRRMFDHGGGHDIPRRREISEKIAELVEWASLKAYGLTR